MGKGGALFPRKQETGNRKKEVRLFPRLLRGSYRGTHSGTEARLHLPLSIPSPKETGLRSDF